VTRRFPLGQLDCSIAHTLEVVGDRWTLLIVREAFLGVRRFEGFLERLPVARNILADRLEMLVARGVLRRVAYQEHPPRFEYRLTAKGRDLFPVLMAMMRWGDRHEAGEAGPSLDVAHAACGTSIDVRVVCPACEAALTAGETRAVRG
jgi:DNA-binding HxlR family transcriptional regulator